MPPFTAQVYEALTQYFVILLCFAFQCHRYWILHLNMFMTSNLVVDEKLLCNFFVTCPTIGHLVEIGRTSGHSANIPITPGREVGIVASQH
jgi:hypothetical protein